MPTEVTVAASISTEAATEHLYAYVALKAAKQRHEKRYGKVDEYAVKDGGRDDVFSRAACDDGQDNIHRIDTCGGDGCQPAEVFQQ